MSSYKTQNDPMDMSIPEIITYLKSGTYIPSHIKTSLQEKIEKHRNENKYNSLSMEEFFAMISPEKSTKNIIDNGKVIEAFPSLNDIDPNNEDNAQINYGALFNIQSDAMSESPKSLFVQDKIVLSFNVIKKVYDDLGIYRIKMQYLILNHNIHLLDTMRIINKNKADQFKKIFKYDDWKHQEDLLKRCIMVYGGLVHIIIFLQMIFELCTKYDDVVYFEKCYSTYLNIRHVHKLFEDEFHKYLQELLPCFEFINNILDNFSHQKREEIIHQLHIIKKQIIVFSKCVNRVINKITKEFDPHIYCEYYVTLDALNEKYIDVDHLCSRMFNLNYEDPISVSLEGQLIADDLHPNITLSTMNRNIEDKILKRISVEEFRHYISPPKKPYGLNFFRITLTENNQCLHFNYKLEEKIPVHRAILKIYNLPAHSHLFASMLINADLNPKKMPNIITINQPCANYWLRDPILQKI